MLDLDISVLVVLLLVWGLMFVLDKFFYKPIGNIVNTRDKKNKADVGRLDELAIGIEDKTRDVEEKLRQARRESMKIKEELIAKGEEVREKFVTEAREKSKAMLAESLQLLDAEISAAEAKLEGEVQEFSRKINEIFV